MMETESTKDSEPTLVVMTSPEMKSPEMKNPAAVPPPFFDRTAFIMCEGSCSAMCQKPAKHRYARMGPKPNAADASAPHGWHEIWACMTCKKERVYG